MRFKDWCTYALLMFIWGFVCFYGFKWQLEQLIIRNYTLRQMGVLPDRIYWPEKVYINLYHDHRFYEAAVKKFNESNRGPHESNRVAEDSQ